MTAMIQTTKAGAPDDPVDLAELLGAPPLRHLAFSFTNRCNLRCVYCPQGTHPDDFHADTPEEEIRLILNYVRTHPLDKVSIGYYGETMLVKGWERYARMLVDMVPQIVFVSSFSRVMNDSEVDAVARFAEVEVSIDSVDIDILKSVRKAVDARTILYNTHRIRAHVLANGLPMPRLVWTGVLTDRVAAGMPDVVAMAVSSGIADINFNDLAYFKAIEASTPGHVADMPESGFITAFEAIQKARRLADRYDVRLVIAGMERLERRARAVLGRAAYGRAVRVLQNLDDVERGAPLYIYGAGQAGRRLHDALSSQSGCAVVGFLDSERGGEIEGKPVFPLAAYLSQAQPSDRILIASMYEDVIEKTLLRHGVETYLRAYHLTAGEAAAEPARSLAQADPAARRWRKGIPGDYVYADDSGDDVPPGHTRQCLSPWTEIYFDPRGVAYSCCFRGIPMATLSEDNGVDVIRNGDAYKHLRRSLLTGKDLDPECSRCTGHQAVPTEHLLEQVKRIFKQNGK